jgi:hypothetical protein
MAEPGNTGVEIDVGVTLQKLQRQMDAVEARIKGGAVRAENSWKRANTNISGGFQQANQAATQFSGNGLRQVSLQLSQVAQQGAVTGDYLRALSIQMPDLLLAFGTFGAIAGVAAGALIPFVAGLINSGEEAKSFEDTIKDLNTALEGFDKATKASQAPLGDLMAQYGAFADRASELLVIQRQLAYLDSASTLSAAATAATDLFGQLERITQEGYKAPEWLSQIEETFGNLNPNAVAAVADALGISTEQAILLTEQIVALQNAANEGPEAVASALRDVIEQLELATGGAFEMNEETRAYYENLLLAEDAALRLAAVDMAASVREARQESELFLANLLQARQQAIAADGQVYGRVGARGDPRTANQQGVGEFDPSSVPRVSAARPSGGGGGGSRRAAPVDPLRGMDPDFLAAVAGRVGEVTNEVNALEQANEDLAGVASDAFLSIVTGSESARDAVRNLLGDLAQLFARAGVQNALTAIGGPGALGGLGSLLRTYDGGGFTGMGVRAGGMDGKGGRLAMVHPNETVIDHTRGQGGVNRRGEHRRQGRARIERRGRRCRRRDAATALQRPRWWPPCNDAQRRGY